MPCSSGSGHRRSRGDGEDVEDVEAGVEEEEGASGEKLVGVAIFCSRGHGNMMGI